MKKTLKMICAVAALSLLALFGYGFKGWTDARADAPVLRQRVAALSANGQGAQQMLGTEKRAILLAVEDPSFDSNSAPIFRRMAQGRPALHNRCQSGWHSRISSRACARFVRQDMPSA